MKIQFFSFFALLFCLACNSGTDTPPTSTNTAVTESTPVEISYAGNPINRFDQAISNMEKEDSSRTVRANEVLFTGSSSIRMWSTLGLDFDPIPVINRGFGGSTLPEVIHYADRIIFSYHPKLIVLYCGENDISDGATPEQVLNSFKKLDGMIRAKDSTTKLIFISMKPSINRWNLWEKYQKGNAMIQEYINTKDDRYYLDCSTVMLTEAGEPDPSIFVEDKLHMNAKGYEGWKALVRPMVEKVYNESSNKTNNE